MTARSVLVRTAVLVTLLLIEASQGILFPGLAPTAHKSGALVRMEVNDIRSTKNPVQLDYYNKNLPFREFKPALEAKSKYSSNFDLGAMLSGERHQWSPYVLPMAKDGCFSLGSTSVSSKMAKRLVKLINRQYRVQMLVDGLPSTNPGSRVLDGGCANSNFYRKWPEIANRQRGYYLGAPARCMGTPVLNNHVHFHISYYRVEASERAKFDDVQLSDGTIAAQQKRRVANKKASSLPGDPQYSELYLIVAVSVVPYSIDWAADQQFARLDVEKMCPVMTPEPRMTPAAAMAENYDEEGDDYDDHDAFDKLFEDDDDDDGEADGEDGNNDNNDDDDDKDDKDDNGVPPDNGNGGHPQDHHDAPDRNDKSMVAFLRGLDANQAILLNTSKDAGAHLVHWTYSVTWTHDQSIKWATRWDALFKNHPFVIKQSSYFLSILLASAVLTALLSLVAAVLIRALRRDLLKSVPIFLSPDDELAAKEEENGWKAVRGDAFRPPPRAAVLSVVVAAGGQVLLTCAASVFCGFLGFAAPANRGGLASLLLFFFLLSSFVGGALCAWLSQALGEPRKWSTVALAVFGFPGGIIGVFTVVNLALRFAGSSGALPVLPMVSLYVMWLVVYCPLGFLGGAAGFSFKYKSAIKVTAVQRVIDYSKVSSVFRTPGVLWYSGVAPFIVGLFLLSTVFSGMWSGVMYYVFGFMCITGGLWLASCALTSMTVVYYNLCGENHRWHWLAFVAPSSGGLPVALFVVWHYFAKLGATTMTGIFVYVVYMSLFTTCYVLLAGSVGFLSSFAFVTFIYSNVKSD